MKKILFFITALLFSVSISAQVMGGGPAGGGPGNGGPGNGMPPGGPRGERPKGMPGDAKKHKSKKSKENKTILTIPQMYVYAIGVSAGDSVVYVTDVQILKDAQMVKSTKFLVNREDYSSQFKTFLKDSMKENYRTCAVVFNEKRNKIYSDYNKLRQKYTKRKLLVKVIDESQFQFVVTSNNPQEVTNDNPQE